MSSKILTALQWANRFKAIEDGLESARVNTEGLIHPSSSEHVSQMSVHEDGVLNAPILPTPSPSLTASQPNNPFTVVKKASVMPRQDEGDPDPAMETRSLFQLSSDWKMLDRYLISCINIDEHLFEVTLFINMLKGSCVVCFMTDKATSGMPTHNNALHCPFANIFCKSDIEEFCTEY
ncbi:uncharacterized protein LAESUDRAFT_765482 [Laetiporus sulphureus 93-53]|uniref:Uncharacterized protein n=1 Tax=Laetiporus sulphureus 93-53 TaxID=1314785 RepID=A0A165AQV0_9APHY|nr:uncharacterized protein LAESUDRAFT_765482 [Laetiporus sulphureus 93-53]KZS99478.1 hypothetical protein LAESUDRAFT_765482 [Laetiporus sulphureus 93-53]